MLDATGAECRPGRTQDTKLSAGRRKTELSDAYSGFVDIRSGLSYSVMHEGALGHFSATAVQRKTTSRTAIASTSPSFTARSIDQQTDGRRQTAFRATSGGHRSTFERHRGDSRTREPHANCATETARQHDSRRRCATLAHLHDKIWLPPTRAPTAFCRTELQMGT
jgi:hypothetical protein